MSKRKENLERFREAHDPTFERLNVHTVYKRKLPKEAKCFLVTAAQNATPVHDEWWQVLQQIAKHRKAEILVLPIRYKNPTSHWSGSAENAEWYDPAVRPFLWNQRHSLNQKLMVLGDFKIQPTAADPLTGAEALSLAQSGIIGHTKLRLRSIPTPASRMAKILTTTGAVTQANHTDSRAGRIAEFHHSLSAVIVEVGSEKRFCLRHVHYDNKTQSATDLDTRYTTKGNGPAPRPLALDMGDTHVRVIDKKVEHATFAAGGIIDVLKPLHLIWNDVLDAQSCTPHALGDPFASVAKRLTGADDVRQEVTQAIDFIATRTPEGCLSVVVPSNHDDMLSRWLKRADWKTDPTNAEFYLETALALVRQARMTGAGVKYPDPFALCIAAVQNPRIKVLAQNESFSLAGVELGLHGDRGPNGARGSTRNLSRIGVKSIKGHSHQPEIFEGCYSTGTSSRLDLDYVKGPSSWLHCHCLLHPDGKRQLVFIIDGVWRSC